MGQIDRVYEGATGRLDHDDVNLDADDLTLLTAFVALANHSLQAARAYLQGSAARTAVALGSSVDGRIGFQSGRAMVRTRSGASARPSAASPCRSWAATSTATPRW